MIELRCRPPDLAETRVLIGARAAAALSELVAERLTGRRIHLLLDAGLATARPALRIPGVTTTELPGGEGAKSFAVLEGLLRELVRAGVDRDGVLVAIGGGSIGDLGGLAAALHLRGIDLVMVPTTLLAMVDSSVGGKTAINLPEGKNLVGTVWPAREVWIDEHFVASLPESEWRSGLGEVLKMAIGFDAELFELCERDAERVCARDLEIVAAVVTRALAAKIRIVESDPREQGPRRLLNLGHTLGHALEAQSGYTIPHGVAVARGLHQAIDVAVARGEFGTAPADRCRALLVRYGFESHPLPPSESLLPFVLRDKKRAGTLLDAVLPTAIGACRTVRVEPRIFAVAT